MVDSTRKLIVTADDMGLYPSVNRGIVKAFREGIVTRTSLICTARGFEDALSVLKDNQDLPVGVHLALVEGRPVLSPEQLPTLAPRDGEFLPGHKPFAVRYVAGRISLEEITAELEAQLALVRDSGLTINHLDSHQHLHAFPAIFQTVVDLARKFGVTEIRYPVELWENPPGSVGMGKDGEEGLAGPSRRTIPLRVLLSDRWRPRHTEDISFTDHFRGFTCSGDLNARLLLQLIGLLPRGVTELMCHPGEEDPELHRQYRWGYRWQQDLQALTEPAIRATLEDEGVKLASRVGG